MSTKTIYPVRIFTGTLERLAKFDCPTFEQMQERINTWINRQTEGVWGCAGVPRHTWTPVDVKVSIHSHAPDANGDMWTTLEVETREIRYPKDDLGVRERLSTLYIEFMPGGLHRCATCNREF